MSANSQDAILTLVQQSSLRTLEFLHAQQRELSQRSMDLAAEEQRMAQRQIQVTDP